MAFGQQDDSGVPLPVIPLTSGVTDNPNAPQSVVPDVTKRVKPFGFTPQKVGYDPNFPLLSQSKGFQAAMEKSKNEPGPDESTLPKSVIMERQLNVMENSPIFKQASPTLRLRLQMAFWKQYVEPLGRQDAHPVELKDWLKARGQKWLETHPNPKISTSDVSKFGLAAADELLVKTGAGLTDIASGAATHGQWENLKKDWFNLKEQIGAANAMLNAQLTPHMGPILVHADEKKLAEVHYNPHIPGMGMTLDDLYEASDYAQQNYYRNTAYDQILLKGGGRMFGLGVGLKGTSLVGESLSGLRAVKSAELLGQTAEETSALRKTYAANKMFGRFGVYAGDVAKNSIHEAAKGYLVGTAQRGGHPVREAVGWGVGSAVLNPAFDGVGKLMGKMRVWGDQQVTEEMLQKAVDDYLGKQPHSQVTPVAVAMAGSPEQKLTRGLMEAINHETNGAFWKAPMAAKQSTLKAIAAKYPELAKNAGLLDQHLTELQALHETTQWRETMPEADAALKKLEALDGEPTVKTIAKQVSAIEEQQMNRRIATYIKQTDEIRAQIKAGQTGVPGAASAGSLEFGDNFTKHVDTRLDALGLGKDKFTWESRGHKLLFYLNVLASETKAQGPSSDRSKEAQLLLNQLTQEFPNKNLKELLTMSDTLWTKISNLEKGGYVKPGVPTRIFRQTHLQPGESPYAHEVDLLQKVAKAERAKRVEAAKAAKEAKLAEATKAKEEKVAKIAKTPTEAPAFKDAASQYISALRKLGYNNDDISKMTPTQLVEIISKKTPKTPPAVAAAKPPVKEMTEDEKLAAAFKKSGDAGTGKIDTGIINQVMDRMFPGQKYGDLTPSEQSEVNQVAAKLSKGRK